MTDSNSDPRKDRTLNELTGDNSDFSVEERLSAVGSIDETMASDVPITDMLTQAYRGEGGRKSKVKVPESIGRYRIEKALGEGGFGCVYLAFDDDLKRNVTIKVPHANRIWQRRDVAAFLLEARTLAKLEHPNIVPVHDMGHTLEGVCYIVSRYIDGSDLHKRLQSTPLSVGDSVGLIATVAQAAHYAHTHGVIHRDIKPNNILLDKRGTPYLADFGLALLDEDVARSGTIAGTPAYMSPEQARGENHLVKSTSDTFALGIVLYEVITGKRPFQGDNTYSILRAIQEEEVRPLREQNSEIPAEIERICMKALSKRACDRHATSLDFADDLNHFLKQNIGLHLVSGTMEQALLRSSDDNTRSSRQFLGIVPKGLRLFGPDDAHFFLGLLPGPYDRDGTPESILFWRRQIEELDPEDTFRVGLIYGPSGCGKSSFVKAGLVPTLTDNITSVVIEAAAGATETRLLNRLRRSCPYLDTELGLRESIATLRHGNVMGEGKKVLIVIDQFEQWLYSVDRPEHSELAKALRQCDGEHVQCILMVRDDFWLAFSRFMEHLEVELMQNQNMAMIDLFDKSHARRVLTEFGRAFGRLPEHWSEASRDQKAFVATAIDDLSENEKITPVRLALFAEMIKGKPWTTSTLRKIGGTAGVGVMFLEENFVSESAPADYRIHLNAVYATLAELLPQPGANLKGHMKSRDELLEASGYAEQPKQFQAMMRALDSELHLITRTDPEGKGDIPANQSGTIPGSLSTNIYYQLAHDYLVPSIRQWQAQMQQGTRKGRAEIRLTQRAEVWHSRPEKRHLPTWTEWATIRAFTSSDRWDESQQRMMKSANRRHIASTALWMVGGLLIAAAVYPIAAWSSARSLTNQLAVMNVSEAPRLLKQLEGRERWTADRLTDIQATNDPNSHSYLFATIALLQSDHDQIDKIRPFLLRSDPETLQLVCESLQPHRGQLVGWLWKHLEDEAIERDTDEDGRPFSKRFNAGLALAAFDPPRKEDGERLERWKQQADYLADELIYFRNIDMQYYTSLLDLAKPMSSILSDRLANVMGDFEEGELRREGALSLLVDLLRDKPEIQVQYLVHGEVDQLLPLVAMLEKNRDKIRPVLDEFVKRKISIHDFDWKRAAIQKANATALLLRFDASNGDIRSVFKPDVASSEDLDVDSFDEPLVLTELKRLVHEENYETIVSGCDLDQLKSSLKERMFGRTLIPNARTKLVQRVNAMGVDAKWIAECLLAESDVDIQCGLIHALGNYQKEDLEDDLRNHVVTTIKGLFKTSPDAEIHASAFWFLNLESWGSRQWLMKELAVPTPGNAPGRQWYVNHLGQTMIQLPQHEHEDRYRVDAAMGEVTLEQMRKWTDDPAKAKQWTAGGENCAVGGVTYNEAVEFCNWLTLAEGLGKDQLCYPRRDPDSDDFVELVPDFQTRLGYRLPTGREFHFMAEGGCITDYSFGSSTLPTNLEKLEELWEGYSANQITDGKKSWTTGSARPNGYGVFDSYMNVREWTSEVRPSDSSTLLIGGMDYRWHWGMNGIAPYYTGAAKADSRAAFWGFRVFRSRPSPSDPPDEQAVSE